MKCHWMLAAAVALAFGGQGISHASDLPVRSGTIQEPYALEFSASNPSASDIKVTEPAGRIWRTASGERFFGLRALETTLPARQSGKVVIPVAALSSATSWKVGTIVEAGNAAEPRVEPLLKYLSGRTDVPRETCQLVAFALLEDITFPAWKKFVAASAPPGPPDADGRSGLVEVLGALGILKTIAPEGKFALAADPGVKLGSLHDPVLRAKALQVFGLTIPGDAPPGGVAPDLGQLLHTKPGDNCPICRLRQAQESRADLP